MNTDMPRTDVCPKCGHFWIEHTFSGMDDSQVCPQATLAKRMRTARVAADHIVRLERDLTATKALLVEARATIAAMNEERPTKAQLVEEQAKNVRMKEAAQKVCGEFCDMIDESDTVLLFEAIHALDKVTATSTDHSALYELLAAEREKTAKVCDAQELEQRSRTSGLQNAFVDATYEDRADGAAECAAAIRRMGGEG